MQLNLLLIPLLLTFLLRFPADQKLSVFCHLTILRPVQPSNHSPVVGDASSACESGKPCGSYVEGIGDNLPESDDVTRPNELETPYPRGDPIETSTHSPETIARHTSPVETIAETADQPRIVDDSDIVEPDADMLRRFSKRLQYSALGNPLISVIYTLFQGLADVCTSALSPTSAAGDPSAPRVCIV